MSHPDEGVLQELLDGELVGEAFESLEAHLAHCDACRARLEAMRATMLEADGLVQRLVVPAPERRGAGRRVGGAAGTGRRDGGMAGRLRFPLSMGQMGIAAGLLVAATAGLLLTDAPTTGRRDGGTADLPAPTAAPDDSGRLATPDEGRRAERISGDTFRLRAGGGAAAPAGKAEVGATAREKEADVAPAAPAPSDAVMRQARDAGAPRSNVTEARTDQAPPAPTPLAAGREIATPEAAAPAGARSAAPASVATPAVVGAFAKAGGERKQLARLTPVRVDSASGVIRTVYLIGATEVVLEERQKRAAEDNGRGQQPVTASARDEVASKQRADANAAVTVPSTEYRWTMGGAELVLRGTLTRDSLVKLSQLVR